MAVPMITILGLPCLVMRLLRLINDGLCFKTIMAGKNSAFRSEDDPILDMLPRRLTEDPD